MKKQSHLGSLGFLLGCTITLATIALPSLAEDDGSILQRLKTISVIASTVPGNGDVNPYGVARIERTIGNLRSGHILVSNFNNGSNLQGTGTTIVDVAPDGSVGTFAQLDASALPGPCPGGIGLTTALVVLRTGWVIVGSLPTTDGSAATAQAGCLIVLDSLGKPVETFSGSLINGPWDMTAADHDNEAKLFVTNVLNGTVAANGQVVHQGTIVRINLKVSSTRMPWIESMTVVGSGFAERSDPAALVIGPTGVALSAGCKDLDEDNCSKFSDQLRERVLYVADTVNNRIAVISDALDRTTSAGTGTTLSTGGNLNGPLGLAVAENGYLLALNAGNGLMTELTPRGIQVNTKVLDNTGSPPGAGTLFGLIVDPNHGIYFVDDGNNTLNLLH